MLMSKEETQPATTPRYVVAIMLPKPAALPLLAIQSKHHLPPWQPKIDLHITLVSPFSASATIETIRTRLAPVAAKTKPFRIKINGFGRFDNAQSIFYAKVTPNAKLIKLAKNTLKAVTDLREPRIHQQFTPHITLAAPADRAIVDRYFTQSIPNTPQLSFTCNTFSLLLLDEKSRQWDIVDNFIFNS